MAILGDFPLKPNTMGKIQVAFSLLVVFSGLFFNAESANGQNFSKADTLLGSLNPMRTCYDVTHYTLDIKILPTQQYIEGTVDIAFNAVSKSIELQVDLASNMMVKEIAFEGQKVDYDRLKGTRAIQVHLPHELVPGGAYALSVKYNGRPQVAKQAPWDGGFVWSSDSNNHHWIGVACEGEGASMWWPCKDHLSDEPDSVRMIFTVPKGLIAVGNGRLVAEKETDKWESFTWVVKNPINTYNVTLNIADYAHIHDTHVSQIDGDTLDLDYYVLSYNKKIAQRQFRQVKTMLECFEQFFGKYPFYEDGYKLVETPYLGMEHQSAIAYGNHYLPGYLGRDDSKLGFDYVIVHESGHEWFGNSISSDDLAALWIHESFTTYSEAIYIECMSTYEDAIDYLLMQKDYIANNYPILGPTGVHFDGWARDSDQYYKGSWMLQTLRAALNDDEAWFALLRDYVRVFRHQVTNTQEVIDFFNERLPFNAGAVMYQYLRHTKVPTLQYRIKEQKKKRYALEYRWQADESGFDLPIIVYLDNGQPLEINPTGEWQTIHITGFKAENLSIDTRHFYVHAIQLDHP